MSKDLHDEPFDEGTLTKLEIFQEYLKAWLPVFIEQNCHNIYIVDFFAGPGKDKSGEPGSPLRIIDTIFLYKEKIQNKSINVNVIFNELDGKKYQELEKNVEEVRCKLFYKPRILNKDFKDIFDELRPELENDPSLLFIDQNGIRHVTKEILIELNRLKRTDFLFFISSSYFIRFPNDPYFKSYFPNICEAVLRKKGYNSIHRKVLEHYRSWLPPNSKMILIPFSIKKSSQIYGLIFGTKHILGADKFLSITWSMNKINGEANFDIDDDVIKKEQGVLFSEFKRMTKCDEFKENLSQYISKNKIVSNKEIYDFTLENGFIHDHANRAIKDLIEEKKMKKLYEGSGLYIGYKQCYKEEKLKKFEWIG